MQLKCSMRTALKSIVFLIYLITHFYMNTDQLQSRMGKQKFTTLETLIEGRKFTEPAELSILEAGVQTIISRNKVRFVQNVKTFLHALYEQKHISLQQELLLEGFENIKFEICRNSKVCSLKQECKAILLVGKTINICKLKGNEQEADKAEGREEFCNIVEQGVLRLHQDGKLRLLKFERDYEIEDILLQHDLSDASIAQVQISNQVLSPFFPIQPSIIMLVPCKKIKPLCFDFLKSSILHVFMDEAQLISKIVTMEHFFKNSVLKGIHFVEEGEVQAKSGRVIARGWTTYGKCKASGIAWKFKPLPFIRCLIKNNQIWKQFINDLKINEDYPFNITHILSLNDEDDFTDRAEWKSLGRRKLGSKSPKLPKIGHKSLNESKYEQVERLRHYDNRINDIFVYKQDLLSRKLKGVIHEKFQPIYRDEKLEMQLERKNEMVRRMNSKKSEFSKRDNQSKSKSSENVLIMSVLKRLESIAETNGSDPRRNFSFSTGPSQKLSHRPIPHTKGHRQHNKILPLQSYHRSKDIKRKRYH